MLNEHPAVVQSAVIGRPVRGNEEVVAYVQLLPGSTATPADVMAHAARLLAPYKRPRFLTQVGSLPHTPSHRVAKFKLKLDQTRRERAVDLRSGR